MASIPKAYVTTSASIDFGIMKNKIPTGDVFGIGISGLSDQSADAALKLNYGSVSMSYHKSLDESGYNTIGAGFQATFSSVTLDQSKLTFESQLTQNGFDQSIPSGEIFSNSKNQNYVDMNAGILYSGSSDGDNNYYIGASVYHINKPSLSFIDKTWNLASRMTLHAGGTFPLNDVWAVSTSGIYQFQNQASETVLGCCILRQRQRRRSEPHQFYVGTWMRFGDAIIPYLGIEVGGLRIGASYDINTSSLKTATSSRGGSEFSLIYIGRKNEEKGIPCPRF